MKKLWLLSAVALGLTACGGGSGDLAVSDMPTINLPSGPYKGDVKYTLAGPYKGQRDGSSVPDNRDGYFAMDYTSVTLATTPSGIFRVLTDKTQLSAPLNAGVVHYSGNILHAKEGFLNATDISTKPFDISEAPIQLTMDFNNKTFTGEARDALVRSVDIVPKFNLTDKGREPVGVTDKTYMANGKRDYILNGKITAQGFEGTATMINEDYQIEYNEKAAQFETTSVMNQGMKLNGSVNGSFYGPNANEVAGEIRFIGNGNNKYDAGFIAGRTH